MFRKCPEIDRFFYLGTLQKTMQQFFPGIMTGQFRISATESSSIEAPEKA